MALEQLPILGAVKARISSITIESCAAKQGTKIYSLVFQTFSGPPFSVRGVAEHSSVMSMVPPFFLLQEVGAWLAFRRIAGTSM
jgi:hypothetical protein